MSTSNKRKTNDFLKRKIIIFKGTYVKDFPLKNIGGATAATMQKPMWTCSRREIRCLLILKLNERIE